MHELIIKGKIVTYNFFPGENEEISHGEFLIQNPSREEKSIKIEECFFLEGERKNKIEIFFVYAEDAELTHTISLQPLSEMDIKLSFPVQRVNAGSNSIYGIEIIVCYDSHILKAVSEIRIESEKEAE